MADLPAPPSFTPAWLAPASVKDWLGLHGDDVRDDALIEQCAAMVEKHVERCRPEFWVTDPDTGTRTYRPDAEAYQGGVMLAAREHRRRNSPAGVELLGEVASFVKRWDPDIARALQTDDYAPPIVA